MNKLFPNDFIWGAATSAYQIEGAAAEDGRGPCVWDIRNKDEQGKPTFDTGDIACDHYHRYKDDIQLMKTIGLKSYRFSISWTRIFPEGYGKVNQLGVDFYNNLINELIINNIKPVITIWHGDEPLSFEKNGGWLNRNLIGQYLNYAQFLFDTYGDRVKTWITHNEPWCAAFLGHNSFSDQLQIAHHLLIAHAKCVNLYRNSKFGDGKIGITLNLTKQYPHNYSPLDQEAANNIEGFINRWFLDPVFFGKYPTDMVELYKQKDFSFVIEENDMNLLKTNPIDFLGINYYTSGIQAYDSKNDFFKNKDIPINTTYTEMGWAVYPQGLYDLLISLKNNYKNPEIVITENGAAFKDEVIVNGIVQDDDRVEYFKGHISALQNAINDGVNVTGYYAWSLMDNFEWSLGYSKRFGIIRVNYETLERSLKKSAYYYQNIIKNNGIIE